MAYRPNVNIIQGSPDEIKGMKVYKPYEDLPTTDEILKSGGEENYVNKPIPPNEQLGAKYTGGEGTPQIPFRKETAKGINYFNQLVNDIINEDFGGAGAIKQKILETPTVTPEVQQYYSQLQQKPIIPENIRQMGQSEYQQAVARAMAQRGVTGNIPNYYGEYVAQQRPAEIGLEARLREAQTEFGRQLYASMAEGMRQKLIAQIATTDQYIQARDRLASLLVDKYAIDKGVANKIADIQLRQAIGESKILSDLIAQTIRQTGELGMILAFA